MLRLLNGLDGGAGCPSHPLGTEYGSMVKIYCVCIRSIFIYVFECVCLCVTWESGGLVWLDGLFVLEGSESTSVLFE